MVKPHNSTIHTTSHISFSLPHISVHSESEGLYDKRFFHLLSLLFLFHIISTLGWNYLDQVETIRDRARYTKIYFSNWEFKFFQINQIGDNEFFDSKNGVTIFFHRICFHERDSWWRLFFLTILTIFKTKSWNKEVVKKNSWPSFWLTGGQKRCLMQLRSICSHQRRKCFL